MLGISGWAHQVHQECVHPKHNFSRAEGHLKLTQKIGAQQTETKHAGLTSVKGELTSMKKVLEYKKKFCDASEKHGGQISFILGKKSPIFLCYSVFEVVFPF